MKYSLGQIVHYMVGSVACSAEVLSRTVVENAHDSLVCTEEQRTTFAPFGRSGIYYSTCHGIRNEECVFASKEELINSL